MEHHHNSQPWKDLWLNTFQCGWTDRFRLHLLARYPPNPPWVQSKKVPCLTFHLAGVYFSPGWDLPVAILNPPSSSGWPKIDWQLQQIHPSEKWKFRSSQKRRVRETRFEAGIRERGRASLARLRAEEAESFWARAGNWWIVGEAAWDRWEVAATCPPNPPRWGQTQLNTCKKMPQILKIWNWTRGRGNRPGGRPINCPLTFF